MENKCQNWRKVANLNLSLYNYVEKWPSERFKKMVLSGQLWPFDLWKWPLDEIKPNPSYDMLLMWSQRSFMSKNIKSYWSVTEIGPSRPLLKVDDDATADDDG